MCRYNQSRQVSVKERLSCTNIARKHFKCKYLGIS